MFPADDLPTLPGSYALMLALPIPVRLVIGRIGTFVFPAGDLVYLGSANGPGGLRARLRHHLVPASRLHWHVDFLRAHCTVAGVVYAIHPPEGAPSGGRLECLWSQALARLPGAEVPAPGFGSADCRSSCAAHLIGFPGRLGCSLLRDSLSAACDPQAAVCSSMPIDAPRPFSEG